MKREMHSCKVPHKSNNIEMNVGLPDHEGVGDVSECNDKVGGDHQLGNGGQE